MSEKREYIWREMEVEQPKENQACWMKANDLDVPALSVFDGEKFSSVSVAGNAFFSPGKYWMPIPESKVLEHIEITLQDQAKTVDLAQAGVEKYSGMLKLAISGIVQIMKLPPAKNLIVQFKEGGSGNCSQVIAGEALMALQKKQTGDDEDFFSNVVDLQGKRIRKGGK